MNCYYCQWNERRKPTKPTKSTNEIKCVQKKYLQRNFSQSEQDQVVKLIGEKGWVLAFL